MASNGIGSGIEGGGGGEAHLLGNVLHPDLTCLQSAFESVPSVGLQKHVARLQDEKAAVGRVQSAGLDHVEVGDQGSELGLVFHAPDQILQHGVALVDDRGARQTAVVDQEVDAVLAEGSLALLTRRYGHAHEHHGLLFVGLLELVGVLDHVGQYRVQVVDHLRDVAPVLAQLVDEVLGGVGGDFAVQLPQIVAPAALVLAHEAHDLL